MLAVCSRAYVEYDGPAGSEYQWIEYRTAPGNKVVEENYISPEQVVQITREEFNQASPAKQQLILAHPEDYNFVNSRPDYNQDVPVNSNYNAEEHRWEVPFTEIKSEPIKGMVPQSVFDASSPERKEYIMAHPDLYVIVADSDMPVVEEKPAGDITKVLVTKKELRQTSKEKRDYILAHPDEFEIIK